MYPFPSSHLIAARTSSTTLDPTVQAAYYTYTNGNLTAENTGPADLTYKTTRSTTSRTAGKAYFEYRNVAETTPGFPEFGVGNSSVNLNAELAADANASSRDTSTGCTCLTVGKPAQVNMAVNDICQVAVDIDNRLIWFKRTADTLWNNTAGADPATATGGYPIAATGAIWVYFNTYSDAGTNLHKGTFNFGATAFAGTAPAGFDIWG